MRSRDQPALFDLWPPMAPAAASPIESAGENDTDRVPTSRTSRTTCTTCTTCDAKTCLRLCVLGSGSGGNCSVIQAGERVCLIDAGFGPRTTAYRLGQLGLTIEDVRAICVTHLDRDHFRPRWVPLMLEHRIPLFLHRWHVQELRKTAEGRALEAADLVFIFDEQPFEISACGLSLGVVRLPHDRKGTCGFEICASGGRIGYATDLGRATEELIERFAGVDILAIESNYDPQLQLNSSRPAFLKSRIMNGQGHLSNQQAIAAIQRIAQLSPVGQPAHVVLLHRSSQCNSKRRIEDAFAHDPILWRRVTLTHQRRRTNWLTAKPPAHAQHRLPLGL